MTVEDHAKRQMKCFHCQRLVALDCEGRFVTHSHRDKDHRGYCPMSGLRPSHVGMEFKTKNVVL